MLNFSGLTKNKTFIIFTALVLAGALSWAAADRVLENIYQVQFKESGGTDKVTVQPPSLGASYTLTWPTTDGNASEFLQTDGSGVLSWGTPAASIGGTITSGTAGSVLFVNAGPVIAQDNSNFFFSDSSNELYLGTAGTDYSITTTSKLQMVNSAEDGGVSTSVWSTTDANGAFFDGLKSNSNSIGTHTAPGSGETTVGIRGYGSDGTNFEPAAAILLKIGGTTGNNDMPGQISFQTTADGANTLTERMTIENSGRVTMASIHNNAAGCGSSSTSEVCSGTYTPTATCGTNCEGAGVTSTCLFSRVGKIVHYACSVTVNPTATGNVTAEFTLPVASNISPNETLVGTMNCPAGCSQESVYGSSGNDRLVVDFNASSAANQTVYFNAIYVLQ